MVRTFLKVYMELGSYFLFLREQIKDTIITILLLYIISARPSKQPLMVRTFLNVYMELGSYFVSARTNKRHHHHRRTPNTSPTESLARRGAPHL